MVKNRKDLRGLKNYSNLPPLSGRNQKSHPYQNGSLFFSMIGLIRVSKESMILSPITENKML